jgi:predicted nucleic acid-binding Zn ribbon protein
MKLWVFHCDRCGTEFKVVNDMIHSPRCCIHCGDNADLWLDRTESFVMIEEIKK